MTDVESESPGFYVIAVCDSEAVYCDNIVNAIFADFDVEYCYLFGSYARGEADEESDVDLLISTSLSGIGFFDLVETIREGLKKKVDVLSSKQIYDNPKLLEEILRDGVKIYG